LWPVSAEFVEEAKEVDVVPKDGSWIFDARITCLKNKKSKELEDLGVNTRGPRSVSGWGKDLSWAGKEK